MGGMRLWSLHPSVLDRAALVACWRESLLAQKVLEGETTGYRSHPQLRRFREHPDPVVAVAAYLTALQREATARGYNFDATRIHRDVAGELPQIDVTDGQLDYELDHLRAKVTARAPEWSPNLPGPGDSPGDIRAHPLFRVVTGPVADWEVSATRR